MDFNEYMNTLMEQINNKRAKKLVEKEIRNHIEEQTETYEVEGLNHMDAENEAVKQMGNPVETGINLNRIHRPKMPYSLLAIAFILTVIGVLMQAVIFRQSYANHTDDIFNSFLGNTIVYNMIGFIVIIVILNLDYSFIAAHSMTLYVLYLITIIWIAIYFRGYLDNFMAPYYATIIFPVILAGLIFRFRNQKTAGLVKCMLLSIFAIGLVAFVFSPSVFELNIHGLNKERLDNDGFMETFIVIVCVLTLAIHKSIFAGNKKIQFAVLWTTITVSGIITAFILYIRHSNILIRMLIGIVPEKYPDNISFQMLNNINARNSTTMFSTLGNSSLPDIDGVRVLMYFQNMF
ncbi:permease prefix domain 1-containing protein [[Clostridium] fimetarium]|uniref:Uncharacterized protein n=1 Tax=[Clostridium] fimetarium TaxID=99656 RepID=A0A1I0RB28_9FIRM|nr:permease prefix domain 1-containing protein [[Clostridium] fimetarium]SEW37465.1 hypothetical protein SAMN05421659_11336 [[Clostridium] fimetarium]